MEFQGSTALDSRVLNAIYEIDIREHPCSRQGVLTSCRELEHVRALMMRVSSYSNKMLLETTVEKSLNSKKFFKANSLRKSSTEIYKMMWNSHCESHHVTFTFAAIRGSDSDSDSEFPTAISRVATFKRLKICVYFERKEIEMIRWLKWEEQQKWGFLIEESSLCF